MDNYLDALVSEAAGTAQISTPTMSDLAELCRCHECDGTGEIRTPHECDDDCDPETCEPTEGRDESELSECLACDGSGLATWTPTTVRDARLLALDLTTHGHADALQTFYVSVLRSIAMRLTKADDRCDVASLAVGIEP